MPRTARAALGGVVYHVFNRGNGRMRIFRKAGDYQAFCDLLAGGMQRAEVELFGFCLMPNHWHLVLRPRRDHDLAAYLSWIANTHVKRYRAHYSQTSGHLYQGRYKSFPVEEDRHFLTLLRYVEANPIRCRPPLTARAQEWRWSSLGCERALAAKLLSPWPVERPARWAAVVNEAIADADAAEVTASLTRGRPLGTATWSAAMAKRMNLQYTFNPRGRPRKMDKEDPKKVDVTF